MPNDDRDAWTAYAEKHRLIHPDPPPAVFAPPARQKYHAIPVTVDGIRFASKKEAARYLELRLMEKTGAIAELERQPVFPLHVLELWRSGVPLKITTVGQYTADFRYLDLTSGEIVVEAMPS